MIFTTQRGRLRRYRTENPYSNPLMFFFLDVFLGLFKALLMCVVLFAAWSAGKAWMKPQEGSMPATASVTEDIVERAPLSQSAVEPAAEIQEPSVETLIAASLADEKIETVEQTKPLVILFDDKWVLNQRRDSFIVQLGSSPEKDKLVEFANELLIDEQAHIYAFKVSSIGNPIYGLGFGLFPDLRSAQTYIDKSPEAYRQFDPWIRPLGDLQDQIVKAKEKLAQ